MIHVRQLLLVTMLALTASCVSPVQTDFDPGHSFANYKTFSWVSESPMLVEGDRTPNPIVAQRLKVAVQQGFEFKGFEFVTDPASADFVVSFTVGARDKIDIREHEVQEYIGPHNMLWRGDRFLYMTPTRTTTIVETREYTEGSLAIDVFDVKLRKPVWHSGATKRLSALDPGRNSPAELAAAVAAITENFPPGQTK